MHVEETEGGPNPRQCVSGLAFRQENFALREMAQPARVIAMHMGHDHPANVARVKIECADSWADLFLGADPSALAVSRKRMPPGLIAWIVGVGAFARVDQDQALRMLNQPRTNRQTRAPIGISENVEKPRKAILIVFRTYRTNLLSLGLALSLSLLSSSLSLSVLKIAAFRHAVANGPIE